MAKPLPSAPTSAELPVRAMLPSLAWPVIPSASVALTLAIYDLLLEIETWPAADIRAHQQRQLAVILRFARDNIPFFRERLGGLQRLDQGAVSPEEFRSVPILTRSELQTRWEELECKNVPKEDGSVSKFTTSGSTGMPVTVVWTARANAFVAATNMRYYLSHGADPKGRLAALRAVPRNPDGTSTEPRGRGWLGALDCGEEAAFDASLPVSQQVEWLKGENPDYLVTYPTNARAVAQYCLAHGITFERLQTVFTFGEALVDGVREAVEAAWGVPVADKYSAREVGTVALECPAGDAYHVQAEDIYVEVLDEAGEPVAPGETGRVVVTPLHNAAMPLIRYEIGDHAEVAERCSCGSAMPALKRIMGRTRNMLTLPNGDKLWPRFNSDDLNAVAPIRQFQLVQTSLQEIRVTLVPERDVTAEEEDALRTMICERLGTDFELPISYVEEIPRSKGGKYEDFKSEVAD